MDHEVVPRPYKLCDWLLNSSHDHFGLHQGKICQSDHGVRGPPKTYSKAYIIHWHGPMGFVVERQKTCSNIKRQGPMAKKCCYNKTSIILYIYIYNFNLILGREDEDKRGQANGQTWIIIFIIALLEIFKKINTFIVLVHGHSSWSTFGLHLVRGPKAL